MSIKSFAKAVFVNGASRLPDISSTLEKLAFWVRFSHWCGQHGAYDFRRHSYGERPAYFEKIVADEGLQDAAFDFLEFGVYQGESLRWWRDHAINPKTRFVGFDTFAGLPADWNGKKAGFFTTAGQIPNMQDRRFSFEVGLFQETLPIFLQSFHRRERLIIHLDADLYSSTLFVLMTLGPLLQTGDLLLFDEFSSVTHEFRALRDFVSCFPIDYELAYATGDFNKVCLRIQCTSAMNLDGAVRACPDGAIDVPSTI